MVMFGDQCLGDTTSTMFWRRFIMWLFVIIFVVRGSTSKKGNSCAKFKKQLLIPFSNNYTNSMIDCPVNVCVDVNKNRNPQTIFNIVCASGNLYNCYQSYVKLEVIFYKNGKIDGSETKQIGAGCIYSKKNPFKSREVKLPKNEIVH